LDKLADAGLLTISYQRPAGRSGPGAGRPAKLYTRATQEMSVSVPPRDYELLAKLLVRQARGGETGGNILGALHNCGYLPRGPDGGRIMLRNCPFHAVAQDHGDVVCGLNLRSSKGLRRAPVGAIAFTETSALCVVSDCAVFRRHLGQQGRCRSPRAVNEAGHQR
jgi:predicted ArsR family transcriptional regulator